MVFTATSTGAAIAPTRARVHAAIQTAAARSGMPFDYLFNQAKVESGLDPSARARTSSATGLFQFIDQTWLGTVKKHGDRHGLGWAAAAIRRGHGGRFQIDDPALKRTILDLRKNPEAASAMAAEFAADNGAALERGLGRPPQPVDLYLAHFLGAGGATRFLRAHDANPGASAASLMPDAARANRWVFFERDGSARSLGEIRSRFAAKIGGDWDPGSGRRAPEPHSPGLIGGEFIPLRMASAEAVEALRPAPLPSPQHARLAYLLLADLGG